MLQVLHQRRIGEVEVREMEAAQQLEVLDVRVPAVVVRLDPLPEDVPGYGHEPGPRFEEPPADQGALPEEAAAVPLAGPGSFLPEVERLPRGGRGEEVKRALVL